MVQTSAPPQGYDEGRAFLFSMRPPYLQILPPEGDETGGSPPPMTEINWVNGANNIINGANSLVFRKVP